MARAINLVLLYQTIWLPQTLPDPYHFSSGKTFQYRDDPQYPWIESWCVPPLNSLSILFRIIQNEK